MKRPTLLISVGVLLLALHTEAALPSAGRRATTAMVVPSSRKRAGLQVAAGAALGSLLQGFNTGVIAGALLGISSEFGLAARPAARELSRRDRAGDPASDLSLNALW